MQRLKKAGLIAAVLALMVGGEAFAQAKVKIYQSGSANSSTNPIFAASDGVAQASITSTRIAVPASSTAVNLTAPSRHIYIFNESGGALLHVNWANGTATTSNAAIPAGVGLGVDLGVAISQFKVIGASASGNFNLVAY